jgi:hypothetical protein
VTATWARSAALLIAPELVEEKGIVLADGHLVRMVRWQGFLEDRERTLEERLGLGVAAGG